jgi:hypothetical protein
MAYQFDFDPNWRLLRCCFEGAVSDDELTAFCKEAVEKIAALDPLRELTDFSSVSQFLATPGNIRSLARTAHSLADPTRPRVILAPSDLIFGTARIFELEVEGARPHVYVVRTIEEALAIFGITQEPHYSPIANLPGAKENSASG